MQISECTIEYIYRDYTYIKTITLYFTNYFLSRASLTLVGPGMFSRSLLQCIQRWVEIMCQGAFGLNKFC